MRAHGGFMSVYSDLGKGSTFRLYFPADGDVAAGAAAQAAAPVPRGAGETLLLIEDDASVRTVMAATLQAYGYRVLQADNGAQALERFKSRAAEVMLVITDVTMPVMDGPHTLRAIREIDPGVPCIVMSGLDDVTARHLPQDLAVSTTLLKPFSAETLLLAVAEHLRRIAP
jgi:DNA-binding response OmpR family regulator